MSEPTQPTPPGAPEPPETPEPPAPPAPPAPPVPPVPQYGEYAPGYVPPAPAPQYAQYAQPAQYPQPAQPYGAASLPQQPGGQRPRKTWDIVLSAILLVVGFFGALIGVVYGILFTDPALLDQALQQQGYGGFSGDAGAAPAVLIVSHIALYLLAVGVTVPMLVKRRVAFWVPLTAGVIAAIVFWSTLIGVLMSDPGFISQLR